MSEPSNNLAAAPANRCPACGGRLLTYSSRPARGIRYRRCERCRAAYRTLERIVAVTDAGAGRAATPA